jgi:hypothetical protein
MEHLVIAILLIAACVCLFIEALKVVTTARASFGWLGLFFWALAVTIPVVIHG